MDDQPRALEFGNIGSQADNAARVGAAFVDAQPTAVMEQLLDRAFGVLMDAQAFRDPFVFAPDGLGPLAVGDADPQQLVECLAGFQQMADLVVYPAISVVTNNQPVVLVEQGKAVRDGIEGVGQLGLGLVRARERLHFPGFFGPGSAIAKERTGVVEVGVAADPPETHAPLPVGRAIAKTAKRLQGLELCQEFAPELVLCRIDADELPWGLAEHQGLDEPGVLSPASAKRTKTGAVCRFPKTSPKISGRIRAIVFHGTIACRGRLRAYLPEAGQADRQPNCCPDPCLLAGGTGRVHDPVERDHSVGRIRFAAFGPRRALRTNRQAYVLIRFRWIRRAPAFGCAMDQWVRAIMRSICFKLAEDFLTFGCRG